MPKTVARINVPLKVEYSAHLHKKKRCTETTHDPGCGGHGTMIACIEIPKLPPALRPLFACIHVDLKSR